MATRNLSSLWICLGIAAGIGIIIGVTALIMTSSFSFGKSGKALSHGNDEIEIEEMESSLDKTSTQGTEMTKTEDVAEAFTAVESDVYTGGAFTASFQGSIGGGRLRSFVITYSPDSYPNVSGSDSWNGSTYLPLEGHYDPDSGSLTLTESNDGMQTGDISGTLVIDRSTGSATYSGQFTNYKNRTYDFRLTGSVRQ